jgi:hypothetical protein
MLTTGTLLPKPTTISRLTGSTLREVPMTRMRAGKSIFSCSLSLSIPCSFFAVYEVCEVKLEGEEEMGGGGGGGGGKTDFLSSASRVV